MMTTPIHRASGALLRGGVLALILLASSGCASVKHVSEFRRLQKEFNAQTELANTNAIPKATSFEAAFEGSLQKADSITPLWEGPDRLASALPAYYYALWLDYAAIEADAKRLNQKAEKELLADGLYATSRTLQLLAMKQRSLYGEIVAAANLQAPTNSRPAKAQAKRAARYGATTPTNSMDNIWGTTNWALPSRVTQVEVLNLAKEIQAEMGRLGANVPVNPRNQFVLKAIKPLLLYDNALIQAIQALYHGRLSASQWSPNTVEPIVRQMVGAERELAAMPLEKNFEQAEPYRLLARLCIMNNAQALINTDPALEPLETENLKRKERITQIFPDFEGAYTNLAVFWRNNRERLLGPTLGADINLLSAPW